MVWQSVAVVMPAYNEHEGIREFLLEIDRALAEEVASLHFVVVDDASTHSLAEWLRPTAGLLRASLRVVTNGTNMGHGPSALLAYQQGLELNPQIVIHVDGDGQFDGDDLSRVLDAAKDFSLDAVHGIRMSRTDPWYRKVITRALRRLVGRRVETQDVNTPLRCYRPAAAAALLSRVPAQSLIPHVHFSLHEAALGMRVGAVQVRHRARRAETSGTMFESSKRRLAVLPSARLLRFCLAALAEIYRTAHLPPFGGGQQFPQTHMNRVA